MMVRTDRPLSPAWVVICVLVASAVADEARAERLPGPIEPRTGSAATPARAAGPAGAKQRSLDDLISAEARRHGVRANLVRAMIAVESNFDPRAVSPMGAQGLMQLMPATAAAFRVEDAFDPGQNIRGGVAYLGHLLRRYDDDETLALAAYNAGPTAVARYGNRVPPYRETRRYIRSVHALAPPATGPRPRVDGRVIYRLDSATGTPRYTNVRPPASSAYRIVGRRR